MSQATASKPARKARKPASKPAGAQSTGKQSSADSSALLSEPSSAGSSAENLDEAAAQALPVEVIESNSSGETSYTAEQASSDYSKQLAKARELGLNSRQERFGRLIATQPELPNYAAYSQAGYDETNQQASAASASRLLSNANLTEYVDWLRAYQAIPELLTRADKRRLLAKHALTGSESASLAAIKIDNEMTGDNQPAVVQHQISLSSVWSKLLPSKGLPASQQAEQAGF